MNQDSVVSFICRNILSQPDDGKRLLAEQILRQLRNFKLVSVTFSGVDVLGISTENRCLVLVNSLVNILEQIETYIKNVYKVETLSISNYNILEND